MTFAERLKEVRERVGQTQTQLAEGSGLSLGTIRNYEQDKREPHWTAVIKISRALGVDCNVFADCVPATDGAVELEQKEVKKPTRKRKGK